MLQAKRIATKAILETAPILLHGLSTQRDGIKDILCIVPDLSHWPVDVAGLEVLDA
jgi:hypothetical protein